MPAPRFGRQLRVEKKCKICMSPHRSDIEDVLSIRSRGETLPDGTRPTEQWIVDNAVERWGIPLNRNNIWVHFKKHFELTTANNLQARQQGAVVAVADSIAEEGLERVPVDQFLESVVAIAARRATLDPSLITVDHGLKAASELTKRKADDNTAKLMQALAGGIQTALSRKAPDEPSPQVVDAEVVRELPG